MRSKSRPTLAAPPPDPFGERRSPAWRERLHLLGARFDFETDSFRLLRIVRHAYARLPAHRFAATAPHCTLRLVLTGRVSTPPQIAHEPPAVRTLAGGGILCGAMDHASFVALTPQLRSGVIVVAPHMLRYSYHVRYELLEFAVYVLAARVQGLVPLHAGCLGQDGQGVLLIGASGSGKSTLVLHGLLSDLDLLAEDSVLVRPADLRATGIAGFVHVRPDSLPFLTRADCATLLRRSSLIRRRSGVKKLEIDVRGLRYRLAPAPMRIRAVVFLSARSAGNRPQLVPLSVETVLRRLAASQRYAAQQPGWSAFQEQVTRLPGYELRRGVHPLAAVEAVRALLAARPAAMAQATATLGTTRGDGPGSRARRRQEGAKPAAGP